MKPSIYEDNSWTSSAFDWTNDTPGFLRLYHPIMERICRYLSSPQDLFQLCLVHSIWSTAATGVLWEAPQFRSPQSFDRFLATVRASKRSALAVKRLSLCVRDEDQPTVFEPIARSDSPRHNQNKNNVLTNPKLILLLARLCERLKELQIYGWHMEPMMIEQLAGMLPELESIAIIGNNTAQDGPFVLKSILPRIKQLRLDGHFALTPQFTGTLSHRCHMLRSLQISIGQVQQETLAALCSGSLNLHELILTHAKPALDVHIERVLKSFRTLRRFCLHGNLYATANVINMAIAVCSQLTSLEIRADENALLRKDQKLSWTRTPVSPLRRLVVENMVLPDVIMRGVASACPSLETLGLKNCLEVSDASMEQICYGAPRLNTFHAIKCENITQLTLQYITQSSVYKTIRQIHMEHCGIVEPKAVYALCCAAAEHNLSRLRFIGYENVATSVIGGHAMELPTCDQWVPEQITFDKEAIRNVAEIDSSTVPELMVTPEGRYLSGEEIIALAEKLEMAVHTLVEAMAAVQVCIPS